MNRNADRVHGFAVCRQRPQAFRDHGHRFDEAAVRGHLHAVAGCNAQLFRKPFADLDELLGLQDRIQPHVLGPVMEVLREAVGRGNVRELLDLTEGREVVREHTGSRVVERLRLARAQRVVGEGGLERLIVLREWAFDQIAACEEARNAFGVHDERPHAECGVLVGLVVRYVHAAPCRTVPRDELALRIKWFAARIAGGTVVHHAPVRGP